MVRAGLVQKPFAKSTLRDWFHRNQPSLAKYVKSLELELPSGRGSSVQLDISGYALSICAWDQGNRLEIVAIDVATGETRVDDNSYTSHEQLSGRLDELLDHYRLVRE